MGDSFQLFSDQPRNFEGWGGEDAVWNSCPGEGDMEKFFHFFDTVSGKVMPTPPSGGWGSSPCRFAGQTPLTRFWRTVVFCTRVDPSILITVRVTV